VDSTASAAAAWATSKATVREADSNPA
jgi:hypothetical protein